MKWLPLARMRLKVGEFWPTDTNCSVPKLRKLPEIGLRGSFKVDIVAAKRRPNSWLLVAPFWQL